MAKLLADENFPRPVADALRALGHDVLTHDRDFLRLHRTTAGAHGGIVHCSVDGDTTALTVRIDAALAGASLPGGLIRVYRPATP